MTNKEKLVKIFNSLDKEYQEEIERLLRILESEGNPIVDSCEDIDLSQFEVLLRCECGKRKHGFANHSKWCPAYVD